MTEEHTADIRLCSWSWSMSGPYSSTVCQWQQASLISSKMSPVSSHVTSRHASTSEPACYFNFPNLAVIARHKLRLCRHGWFIQCIKQLLGRGFKVFERCGFLYMFFFFFSPWIFSGVTNWDKKWSVTWMSSVMLWKRLWIWFASFTTPADKVQSNTGRLCPFCWSE